MKKLLLLIPFVLSLCSHAQTTHVFCALDNSCTWTGVQTFQGVAQVGPVYYANEFASVQAAINAANPSGLGGTVYVPSGTYVGPTSIPDNTSLVCIAPPVNVNAFGAFNVGSGTAATQCTFTYTAQLFISIHNVYVKGITFNMNNTANSFDLNNSSFNIFDDVWWTGCAGTCLALTTTGSGGTNNTIRNEFNRGGVLIATGVEPTTGVYLNAATSSGPAVTLNRFNGFTVAGYMLYCIDLENSTDTNYFRDIYCNQDHSSAPANSAVLAFNTSSPAGDIDADASMFDGINATGYPTDFISFVRSGQATGNFIRVSSNQQGLTFASSGTPDVYVLGGSSPSFTWETMQLSGGWSEIVSNRLSSLGAGLGTAAASTEGDLTVAETSTLGIIYLGTDGVAIYRVSSSPVSALNCVKGSIAINSGATNASTVLYVCGATNTWTAVTAP